MQQLHPDPSLRLVELRELVSSNFRESTPSQTRFLWAEDLCAKALRLDVEAGGRKEAKEAALAGQCVQAQHGGPSAFLRVAA